MVIPNVARQKGITVRLYAGLFVVFTSAILPLIFSHSASAAPLPISDIPIIGKPIAGVVGTVTNDVVKPVTRVVTGALPQPLGAVVQAPVDAVITVVDPVELSRTVPATNNTLTTAPTTSLEQAGLQAAATTPRQMIDRVDQRSIDTTDAKTDSSITSYTPLTLSGYLPVISDMIIKFVATRDLSPFIAAAVIIGLMLIILGGLLVMIARNGRKSVPAQEMVFIRQDLAQASLLIAGLLATGLVLLFYILH